MNAEAKICQNCKQQFTIEPDDFSFYEKIQVPPPTFCPACRTQRRLTWRNERTLYRGTCAATGKNFITMFAPENGLVVYDRDYWWGDEWDQLAAGRDYDFSKPFFTQFRELLQHAPLPNLANTNVVNSPYGNHNADCKNCYLAFASFMNEDVSYANGSVKGKDSFDLYVTENVSSCYEDMMCAGLNQVFFSYDADESLHSAFLRSCKNMSDCFACINSRNKSFHIFNQPYSKEDYRKKLAEFDLGSYKMLMELKNKFQEFCAVYPRRYASILRSSKVTGDSIMNSKNIKNCFDVWGNIEDSKYVIHTMELKDSYDGYGIGAHAELMYEAVDSGINASRCTYTVYTHGCHDVEYAYCCQNASNLFGCIGLRSKQYCILNKQYSKEEYEALVPKIMQQMQEMPYIDSRGRKYGYGEFFPQEISPFAYNETIAQEYFPLTKERAAAGGFSWKDEQKKNYEITIQAADLPDHIKEAKDNILNEVIGCEHAGTCAHQCTGAFKIIPQELQFYRRFNIALPRLCSNCRHYERLAKRNPFRLWHRPCQCAGKASEKGIYQNIDRHAHGENHCPVEFESPYAPQRPEIVYCEECYQAEVV